MTSERAEHHGVLADVCDRAEQLVSAAGARLHTLSLRVGDVAVELEWSPAATPASESPGALPVPVDPGQGAMTERESLHHIRAEMVGTFYSAAAPGAEPFVSVGDEIQRGQQVAILEVMKLMTPVEADRAGRVAEVLVPDGKPVEYGTALIALEPC